MKTAKQSRLAPCFLAFAGALLIVACASGVAAEVQVGEMSGILHAVAGSACPPDGEVVREDFITDNLQDYEVLAQADTASTCGVSTGLGTLITEIQGNTITAVLTAGTYLDGHRTSLGSSFFSLEFEVTVPTDYTLSMTGASTYDLDPGVMGLSLRLRGVHEIQGNHPDFTEDWSGTLAPGHYVLDGSCSTSRSAYDIGGSWIFEAGQSEVSGSLNLTFTDEEVVRTQSLSLGALKARYR